MNKKYLQSIIAVAIILFGNTLSHAGNIEPGSKMVWSEDTGWINFAPENQDGVTVSDTSVSGLAWGENIGWINLSPSGQDGVMNDGNGNLSGYAWSENCGWLNFTGVAIDHCTGIFSGNAWAENAGWISFFSDGAVSFQIKTQWRKDSDGDGTPDCNDNCPNDSNKVEPGTCGCGTPDTDSDGDNTPDCNDNCDNDPYKTEPGACGCEVADTDSDGDGTPDCNDNCPDDTNKLEPGICGCGRSDRDSDRDGRVDCQDGCPSDGNKTEPGACGCGVADTDSDGDGTPDCNDNCPNDPNKVEPGTCGCGIAATDSDGDGTLDCNDNCPDDPAKLEPGTCGCGVAETDTDNDGIPDCNDACDNDKDSDGDGAPDCTDECPNDPNKIAPGECGCGVADIDSDGDSILDCFDTHPDDPDEWADNDDDGIGDNEDTDDDNDGMPDDYENENGLDPTKDDAEDDADGDGYSNLEEFSNSTDPNEINSNPGQPVPIDPEQGTTDVSLTPSLVVEYEDTADISTHLQTQWQASLDETFETIVLEIIGDEFLTELPVPDMILAKDTLCFWRARFIDVHGHEWGWSDVWSFTTSTEPFVDANFNNIPDDQDVDPDLDLDGNGEPDISQDGMFCARLTDQSEEVCISIPDNSAIVDSLYCVDPETISDMTNRPDNFPLGLVSFRIIVENPGDTVQAVIYFVDPLPSDIGWYMYDTINGWQDFSQYADFNEDRTSMTLTLTDGGFGDADGITNGVIVDPSGPVIMAEEPEPEPETGDGGSDGGCFLRTLLGF